MIIVRLVQAYTRMQLCLRYMHSNVLLRVRHRWHENHTNLMRSTCIVMQASHAIFQKKRRSCTLARSGSTLDRTGRTPFSFWPHKLPSSLSPGCKKWKQQRKLQGRWMTLYKDDLFTYQSIGIQHGLKKIFFTRKKGFFFFLVRMMWECISFIYHF